jgi:hypothetical protein
MSTTQQQVPKLPIVFILILTFSAIMAPVVIVYNNQATISQILKTELRYVSPNQSVNTNSENAINVQNEIVGVWKGRYSSSGTVTLTINNDMTGVFDFVNAGRTGSYKVSVEYSNGVYNVVGKEWISRPSGYNFFNLNKGVLSNGILKGTDFQLEKASAASTPSSTLRENAEQKEVVPAKTSVVFAEKPPEQIVPEPEIEPNKLTPDKAYQEGKNFTQKSNYAKAVKFYQSAADRGIAAAAYDLALLYQDSQGVAKSEQLAFKYMKFAADAGYVNAFRPLGEMYHGGKGVTKDRNEAEKWYKKAVDSGDESARILLYNM